MNTHATQAIKISTSFRKTFPDIKEIIAVTFGGKKMQLSTECLAVPIVELHDFLKTIE